MEKFDRPAQNNSDFWAGRMYFFLYGQFCNSRSYNTRKNNLIKSFFGHWKRKIWYMPKQQAHDAEYPGAAEGWQEEKQEEKQEGAGRREWQEDKQGSQTRESGRKASRRE